MSKPASEKWQRRFFVAKDGFLLYYANGRSDQAHFDTKPKGCIPLGGCKVDLVDRGPKGIRFGLRITHPDFFAGRLLILAAENEADQKVRSEHDGHRRCRPCTLSAGAACTPTPLSLLRWLAC